MKFAYCVKVILLEEVGLEYTINDHKGKWSKIKWLNKEGWVFGGFLSNKIITVLPERIKGEWLSLEYENNEYLIIPGCAVAFNNNNNELQYMTYMRGWGGYKIIEILEKENEIKIIYNYGSQKKTIIITFIDDDKIHLDTGNESYGGLYLKSEKSAGYKYLHFHEDDPVG